jgi:hypothetical protein
MAVVKDSTYFLAKLQASMTARIPSIIFRLWDPMSTLVTAVAKRAAEIVALMAQNSNDFYIDSAQGAKLDRRLGNEGIPRILAKAANDGTITLTRQTEYSATITIAAGALTVSQPPDPSSSTTSRPQFTNTAPITIGPGLGTSFTVAFAATRGGTDTNLLAGTRVLLTTQATLFDTATVATAFTVGTNDELDDAYRRRGKFALTARAKGTDEAIVAAALAAGCSFAFTVENYAPYAIPVTLYCAAANGVLSTALQTEVLRQLNGDHTVSPILPAARAKGLLVDVQAVATVSYAFTIKLILQSYVVDGPAGNLLTNLRTDIATGIQNYIVALNDPTSPDRTMRINRIKDICLTFRNRGVIDVDDSTFLPAATGAALTAQQMALYGGVTWL